MKALTIAVLIITISAIVSIRKGDAVAIVAPVQDSGKIAIPVTQVQQQAIPLTSTAQIQAAPISVPVQAGDVKQLQVVSTPASCASFSVGWFSTNFGAADIGVGSEGDVYVVGLDSKLYQYNFLYNNYALVEGDYDMNLIARVDVDDDGTPYVVSTCGNIFYLNCYNNWVQLPGCATDIGVGRGMDVWKIGCDARAGGFGIWKLFCKCKSKCGGERDCIRFRNQKYSANMNGDRKKCYWYRIEGGAVKVDVHPDGNPWVATDAGYVYGYDGINWHHIDGVLAKDLSVSNEGMVFAAGADTVIYSLQNVDTQNWAILSGSAASISAGPYAQPWSIGSDSIVYTTSKMGFN